jgi:L-rhamnose mutarotase
MSLGILVPTMDFLMNYAVELENLLPVCGVRNYSILLQIPFYYEFQCRKATDLYLWMAKCPNGPSV